MLLDCRLIVRDRSSRAEEARWYVGLEGERDKDSDISVGELDIPDDNGMVPPVVLYGNDLCYDDGYDRVIKTVELIDDIEHPFVVERNYITDKEGRVGRLFRVVHRYTRERIRRFVIQPIFGSTIRTIDPMGLLLLRTMKSFNRPQRCLVAERIYELYNDVQTHCRAMEYHHTVAPLRFDMHTLTSALQEDIYEFKTHKYSAEESADRVAEHLIQLPNYKALGRYDYYSNLHSKQTTVNLDRVIGRYGRRLMDTSPCEPLSRNTPTYPNMSYFGDVLDEITALNLTDFHVWFKETGMQIDYVVNRYAPFQDLKWILPENEISPSLRSSLVEAYYQTRGGSGYPLDIEVTLTYDDEVLITFYEGDADPYHVYFDLNRCALLSATTAINSMSSDYVTETSDEYDIRDVSEWD